MGACLGGVIGRVIGGDVKPDVCCAPEEASFKVILMPKRTRGVVMWFVGFPVWRGTGVERLEMDRTG